MNKRASYGLGDGEYLAAIDDGNSGGDPLTVEVVENHIYFYSSVTSDRCLALIKEIRALDKKLRTERISRNLPDDYPGAMIWLHLQSGGGDLFPAFAIVDQIAQISTPIFSVVEGFAASAATLIAMACTRRYIQPSAYMLIHQMSGMIWGTYEQLKDEMGLSKRLMQQLIDFYAAKSKLSVKKIQEMLKRDTWLDAGQCVKMGLVDEVLR